MPRANYECVRCAASLGDPITVAVRHEDLPVGCKFCPGCGCKEGDGFTRLFDSVNVMSGNTRETGKLIEHQLAPIYKQHSDIKASATQFERGSKEAMEKAYEKATPEQRRAMNQITHEAIPVTKSGLPGGQSFVHNRPFGMPITRNVVPMIEKRK